ncbi:MAG TPA: hypothetical protein DD827_09555 [Gammaproteobacteria bacterium]|jgi:hypothetical protein|nr:hypothetical protein [Gammaproteobacteria bacterium]
MPSVHFYLRKLQLLVLLFWLAFLVSSCETRNENHSNLPWQIELNAQQHSTIFGVTLGETKLKTTQEQWHGRPSIALFSNRDEALSLEAYFERVSLGPFQVKMVTKLQADEDWLKSIQQQAPKPRPGPSGDYRYLLDEIDLKKAESMIVSELTYIPGYKVEGEILRQRFGEPDQIKKENENTEYWLYASKGLLVTINQPGKDVFHYTNPAKFSAAVDKIGLKFNP